MRPGETVSLSVTLPNEQRIEVSEVVVRWSRGQEFAVGNVVISHTHTLGYIIASNDWCRNQRRLSCG
jgi:hypothetical protein